MKVSRFQYYATVERPAAGNELRGEPTKRWTTLFECWCDRKGVSGREHLVGGAQQIAEQTHTIHMHFDDRLNENCRIVIEDHIYQVLSIVWDRRRYMTVLCKARPMDVIQDP